MFRNLLNSKHKTTAEFRNWFGNSYVDREKGAQILPPTCQMQDACEFLEYLLDPIFSEKINGLCRFQKVEIYECQWCFKVSKVENPLDMGTRLILANLNNETSLSSLIKLSQDHLNQC